MINFQKETYSKIIGHLLKDYHTPLKKEIPEIEKLVYTIYKVHFEDSGETLEKVHDSYGRLKILLETHIIKEERALFFMIKDYEEEPSIELLKSILKAIDSVEKDNERILEVVKELELLTDGYTVPPSGCPTYVNTYTMIKELGESLQEHIKIESIIFKRLRSII